MIGQCSRGHWRKSGPFCPLMRAWKVFKPQTLCYGIHLCLSTCVSNLLPPQELKSWTHACPCRPFSGTARGTLLTLKPLKQPAQPNIDSNCSTGLVVASFQSNVHPQAVCTEAETAFSRVKSLFTSAPIMAQSQPTSPHTARPHRPNTLSP